VKLVQGEARPPGEFTDVPREPPRTVKEAVQELPGGRLVLKKATGVVIGLWPGHAFAIGDLRRHLNQGINLVNACYAKAVLGRGHLLLHASGVSWNGRAAVLAGRPGAGKSTAALHLVEAGFRFLSLLFPVGPHGVLAFRSIPCVHYCSLIHSSRAKKLRPNAENGRSRFRLISTLENPGRPGIGMATASGISRLMLPPSSPWLSSRSRSYTALSPVC